MTTRALSGVRVLDFCWVGAGPFTTKFLADQGADVIKVESIHKLDGLRLTPPFADGESGVNRSGYFADRNTNKRSLCLNMAMQEARDIARRLVAQSDIVSNSFTPGVMDKFGLSYEAVREINPRAIYLSMSMHGQDGPESSYLGYGMMIGALTGLHHLSGFPGRLPLGTGTNYPDHVPNPGHAAFALLAALRHQRRTGVGQYIDIAQTEPMVALLGTQILEYTANGHDPQPLGNADLSACPQGVYPCLGEDRWLTVTVENDVQWAALVRVLDLAPQHGWETVAGRRVAAEAIDAAIAAATRRRDAVELMRTLQAAGVPAGVVNDVVDVVDRDPQLAHRRHWVRLPHPEMGQTLYNAPPFRFSAMSVEYRRGAPLLGEHTAEVCREILGMSNEEITRLTDEGVLT